MAALVRAKFPNLTAHQVIRRITETAHNPAHGVDNQVGHGVVDPVAALTFDIPPGDPKPLGHLTTALHVPPPPPGPDMRPRNVAVIGVGAGILLAGIIAAVAAIRRRLSVKARTVAIKPALGAVIGAEVRGHRRVRHPAAHRFGWWPLAVITVIAVVLLLVTGAPAQRRPLGGRPGALAAPTPLRHPGRRGRRHQPRRRGCARCAPLTTRR